MAANGLNHLDSVITVKVSFEDVTRRVKMPLRDATPPMLERQLRAFLHIPVDWQVTIERFSDSAGDYIALEPSNIAAYKQLYRAAKAKSKLKLRVSRKEAAAGVATEPLLTIKSAPNGAPVEPMFFTNTTGVEAARFAICCNNCEKTISDIHYHCSTCEDGDFDLCQACVDKGVACNSSDHWLIKRTTNKNGQVITSTTQTVTPGEKTKVSWDPVQSMSKLSINGRTCNGCVQEFPVSEFLHCQNCEDFDLCHSCFDKDVHGHHPKHAFEPAVLGTKVPEHLEDKVNPGRNLPHHAICDNCNKFIVGVRHKCLDCPDWDLCAECIPLSATVHPKHRFVPIYDSITLHYTPELTEELPVHTGVCCDGPVCKDNNPATYIRGIRFKCTICEDVDFCAGCEANPKNTHNKTHPVIKFKTPVRQVSVTTTGEHSDGQKMPAMGDKPRVPVADGGRNATQSIIGMRSGKIPHEPIVQQPAQPKAPKAPKSEASSESSNADLRAVFVADSIPDGTVLPANTTFEQTWVLRNEGTIAWPAGCSVKFVGGDYMGQVDSSRPAAVSEIVSASESTVCYQPLAPGQTFSFTVLLRTPSRAGKVISYWRLTTKDGHKFGHRLWCDVNIRTNGLDESGSEPEKETKKTKAAASGVNTMIYPKAETTFRAQVEPQQATSSFRTQVEPKQVASTFRTQVEPKTAARGSAQGSAQDDDSDASTDGFLTDEEYDILDASDEEFFNEQLKQ